MKKSIALILFIAPFIAFSQRTIVVKVAGGGVGTTYTANTPAIVTGTVISIDTVTRFTGLATLGKAVGDSNILRGLINTNTTNIATNTSNITLKQNILTLTTTGTSGASTLVGATLNIPQYLGGGGGGLIDSVYFWKKTGNVLLNRTSNFIGSIDTSQFHIKTKGLDAIVIDSNQNIAISGSLTANGYLFSSTTVSASTDLITNGFFLRNTNIGGQGLTFSNNSQGNVNISAYNGQLNFSDNQLQKELFLLLDKQLLSV
jgi:hypothetical protein